MFNNTFQKSCPLLNNVDRPQMTKWRMRISCWIPKATNTHTEYIILIVFPLHQWLQESGSVLRYTNIPSLAIVTSKKLLILQDRLNLSVK
jgi:hypothetical protein